MMTIFLDIAGTVFIHFIPKGEVVNSENYCELLQSLRVKIKSKRHGKLSKGVIFLQDNI